MRRALVAFVFLSGCRADTVASDGASGDGGSSTTAGVLQTGGSAVPGYSTTRGTAGESTGLSTRGSSSSGEPQVPDLPFLPAECPGDVLTGDILDPDEVYIFGRVDGGDAISHWSTPNHAVAGFGNHSDVSIAIRPADGRVLYADLGEGIRRFHCDGCPWVPDSGYPSGPLANDPIIDSCPMPTGFIFLLIAPDGGHLYNCEGTWFDPTGQPRYAEEFGELLHLGHDDWALTQTGVVNLEDSSFAELIDLPMGEPVAVRADVAGGFFVATGEHFNPELFHVGLDGRAVSMGQFPRLPEDYIASPDGALDGCLALYQIGRAPEDVILRRAIGDETRVVYTEATDPLVTLHISRLLTGV